MAIEPMVSCTVSDVSYIYPHKLDVQFISTPSWFVWGSFLSMFVWCKSNTTDVTYCLHWWGTRVHPRFHVDCLVDHCLSFLTLYFMSFYVIFLYAAMLKKSVIGNFKDTCCKVDFEFWFLTGFRNSLCTNNSIVKDVVSII